MPYIKPLVNIREDKSYLYRYLIDLASNMSTINWYDVTLTAALLDGAGQVVVAYGNRSNSFKVRGMRLNGGGTSFGAGGNRTIGLTDGTTTWTTIPNATIESAPATTVDWGNTAIPFLTGTSNTGSAVGSNIYFTYNGGTTDHSTGSIVVSVCLEKVAN